MTNPKTIPVIRRSVYCSNVDGNVQVVGNCIDRGLITYAKCQYCEGFNMNKVNVKEIICSFKEK